MEAGNKSTVVVIDPSRSMSEEEPYDINFCFSASLTSFKDLMKLIIVDINMHVKPSKHTKLFIDEAVKYPDMFRYLPFGPFRDTDDFNTNLIDARIRNNSECILFVIYDKTRPSKSSEHTGTLAGVVGLINSSRINLCTEIGCVMILPSFQRTHVASNAVGILLHYTLDKAGANGVSLGLRRVVWQANELNEPSLRLAKRMGFVTEAVLKWDRVLPAEKYESGNGVALRDGDPRKECSGRNTALLSLTWDDWETGSTEIVDRIMARVQ